MSTDTLPTTPRRDDWADDEIDLRKYMAVMARRWLEILLLTGLMVVVVAASVVAYRAVTAPSYEAFATAAIVRTSSDVNFDERFTTTADQMGSQDVSSRRAALASLVNSSTIAQQVIEQLGPMLSAEERNPAHLLNMVVGEIGGANGRPGQSDLITIKVTADAPQKAADIANAWATAYVQEVNRIYGQVPDEMLASVETELREANTAYAIAQTQVQEFLATSQLDALERQQTEKQQTIESLQRSKTSALETYVDELVRSYQRIVKSFLDAQTANQLLAFSKEQEGQRALLNSYLDAYNAARVDTFSAQYDRDRAQVRLLYERWLQTTADLAAASTLASQLDAGGAGAVAGTSLALQVLKMQMVMEAGRIPLTMGDLYQPADVIAGTDTGTPQLNITTNSQEQEQPPAVTQVLVEEPTAAPTARGTTSPIQLHVDASAAAPTLEELRADAVSVVASLEAQRTRLEEEIAALNAALLAGDHFTDLSKRVPETSALVQAIQAEYPKLFETGDIADLGSDAAEMTALAEAGRLQAANLLSLAGTDTLTAFTTADDPLSQAIAQLEADVRTIQASLEAEQARELQTRQQRDLTWESYSALNNKLAELNLARAAGNSEVRMGIPAVAPTEPTQGISLALALALAAVAGLLLAVAVAFIREYMNHPPIRARSAQVEGHQV